MLREGIGVERFEAAPIHIDHRLHRDVGHKNEGQRGHGVAGISFDQTGQEADEQKENEREGESDQEERTSTTEAGANLVAFPTDVGLHHETKETVTREDH